MANASVRFFNRGFDRKSFRLLGLALLALAPIAAQAQRPPPQAPSLDHYLLTGKINLADRIFVKTQIERIYYNHRIWPSVNPGPKPTFEVLVPASDIEDAVLDSMKKSLALERRFGVVISTEQIQGELDRMVKTTNAPGTLLEIFTALNNDPVLIAVMARENLTNHLILEAFASSESLHHAARARGRQLHELALAGIALENLGAPFERLRFVLAGDHLAIPAGVRKVEMERAALDALRKKHPETGRLAPMTESNDALFIEKTLDRTADSLTLERVTVAKVRFGEWWARNRVQFNPPAAAADALVQPSYQILAINLDHCKSWNPTRTSVLAHSAHTAVWTGNELIIWGGEDSVYYVLNTGSRYDPTIDTWLPISTGKNVPDARSYHTAVWTGSEMIVWGGLGGALDYLNTGGRYKPATDSWAPTSTGASVPIGRLFNTAVWTGNEMIVWGGNDGASPLNSGGRYDPATDTWITTSIGANVPSARVLHTAVWTGSEMIVWGGNDQVSISNSGGRYNPATDNWAPTSMGANVPTARAYHTAVWTGSVMIIWGGADGTASLNSGGRYDPATDSWIPTSIGVNVPAGRYFHTAIWTGSEMIVWGGSGSGSFGLNSGGRYSPGTDSWLLTSVGMYSPDARRLHTAVWTGSEMIVWGGDYYDGTSTYLNSGGRYYPGTDSWLPTHTGLNVPAARFSHTSVWTGAEMIVSGGNVNPSYNETSTGGKYYPDINEWRVSLQDGTQPLSRTNHSALWTGSDMIVWGGCTDNNTVCDLETGGRYTLGAMDSWTATTTLTPTCPVGSVHDRAEGRSSHTAVWSGTDMIIFGGARYNPTEDFGILNTWGRYIPATNQWACRIDDNPQPPSQRKNHTAVWTDSQMIVWGGICNNSVPGNICIDYFPTAGVRKTGGIFAPGDNWGATNPTTAPAHRFDHAGVWTGNEMIVWGGRNIDTVFNDGSKYDPATDSWIAITTDNSPSARRQQTAVWAGNSLVPSPGDEMIVWGGQNSTSINPVATGGRYNLATGSWQSTPIDSFSPEARALHTAVWTQFFPTPDDNRMIVWGGYGDNDFLATGGVYDRLAPYFTEQPQPASQFVCPGDTVTYNVNISPANPTQLYQWRKDGVDIFGANSSTLNLDPVGCTGSGSYDAVLSGTCSATIASTSALLNVITPVIISGPTLIYDCSPLNLQLSVAINTNCTNSWQWQKFTGSAFVDLVDNGATDNTMISGATTSLLTMGDRVAAGEYRVQNICRTITSPSIVADRPRDVCQIF